MAKETAIAYGIEFYVGRRSRDKAVSDVRAAGELVNQQAQAAYKRGANERQKTHDEAVKKLRTRSKTAMDDLAKARNAAAKQASASFDRMKPPTVAQLEEQKGRKLSTSELESYSQTFGRELKAMEGSMASFVERSGKMGVDLGDAEDTAGVMKKFSEADVQDRTRLLADLENESKARDDIIKRKKKEQVMAAVNNKEAKANQTILKKSLADERAILKRKHQGSAAWKVQNKLVNKLAKEQTRVNKLVKEYTAEEQRLQKEIRETTDDQKAKNRLLRELNTLQKKATAEERKYGKISRDIGNEERALDKKLAVEDKQEILRLKERNRLMNEYSRHIDDAAQKVGNTLKNAFVVGTAAIAALNYKLMSVVSGFQAFEKELINANSIWRESNDNLFAISDSVVSFGMKYGVSMENATAGLYQMASAGLSAAESQLMLQHTLKLSMAVQGDHNTLSKLTTQTIMGFNMEFGQAEEVTDKFAHAINKSLIEWDDLASSIKFALPFFISTGQSLDQLLGGLEVLTNRALEAGIAGRGLRQALAEFTQHADDNSAAFRKLGIEILDEAGNMKALDQIAQDFNKTLGDQASDMELMMVLMEDLNVRGATAFVHLAQNADEFTAAVQDLQNSAGEATAMADEQQKSLENQIQVVKNALMAPFILSDQVGEEAGYLNKFAMEIHGIVDVVQGLFIETMADGSTKLSEMGILVRDFVIGALHQAKDVLIILVDIVRTFTESGNDMTGMLNAFTIPLKIVLKLMRFFGDGFMETIILYKVMNSLLPINSLLIAKNYQTMLASEAANMKVVTSKGRLISVTRAETALTVMKDKIDRLGLVTGKTKLEMDYASLLASKKKVVANWTLTGSLKAMAKSQMAVQMAMFGMIMLTQKIGKDSVGAAAAIGALAGAFFGLSIALNSVGVAKNPGNAAALGVPWYYAVAAGAIAGAAFNVLMMKMMQPPPVEDVDFGPEPTMDMGGRFIRRRTYDMGGRYTQEHGMAILKNGETVIPKTGNMLGEGITLNMGDIHVQDGEDFAERVATALPQALRRANETGGI